MITNISLHYDSSSNPLDVYKIKNFLKRKQIGFADGVLHNDYQTSEFIISFSNAYKTLLEESKITFTVPLNNVYLYCHLNADSNTPKLVQGLDNILSLLNTHF